MQCGGGTQGHPNDLLNSLQQKKKKKQSKAKQSKVIDAVVELNVLSPAYRPDICGGIIQIRGEAVTMYHGKVLWGNGVRHPNPPEKATKDI